MDTFDEDRIHDRIILKIQSNIIYKNANDIIFQNNDYDTDGYDSRHAFYSLVDRTITEKFRHLNLKLNKFLLNSTYDSRFKEHVNNSIRYALDCNVQDLGISLRDDFGKAVDQFVFDRSFFINPSFTHLKLECSFANPTGFSICWENLKSLCLSDVFLNDDLIQSVLSGSPHLETFKLNYCYGFTRLDITSKSVKKFAISGYKTIFKDDFVHLNAPSILSLTVQGCMILCDLVFLDLSSLVKAKFYCVPEHTMFDDNEERDSLKEHIQKLGHVKHLVKLKLGMRCSAVLSRLEAQSFNVPPNIKYVVDHELD